MDAKRVQANLDNVFVASLYAGVQRCVSPVVFTHSFSSPLNQQLNDREVTGQRPAHQGGLSKVIRLMNIC